MSGALIRKSAIALRSACGFVAWRGFWLAGSCPPSFLAGRRPGLPLHQSATSQCRFSGADPGRGRQSREDSCDNAGRGVHARRVAGFSLLSFVRTSYSGLFLVTLKDWDERKTQEEQLSGDQGRT